MNSFQIKPAFLGRAAAAFLMLVSAQAHATDVRILEVRCTNDTSIPTRTLLLGVNAEGDVTGLKIFTTGQGITSDYKPDDFRHGSLVLFQSDPDLLAPNGRDIIRLDARLVNPEKGGRARMEYVTNALTGNSETVELDLERAADGHWALLLDRQPVRTLQMVKGSLGVKEIEFR